MELGVFTNSKNPPSHDEIREALGSTYSFWEKLTQFIETTYKITGEFSTWGPKDFGWGLRYKRNSRSLIALYPQKGGFIAQVVLGKAQAERALKLKLSEKVSKMLKESPQLRDGRWLSINVITDADAEDVEQLLLVKMPLIRSIGGNK